MPPQTLRRHDVSFVARFSQGAIPRSRRRVTSGKLYPHTSVGN